MNIRKPTHRLPSARFQKSRVLAGSVAVLLACHSGQAATAYLDINGTTAGSGISANSVNLWDTSAFWNSIADGTGAAQAWNPGDTAIFSAGADAAGLPYTVIVNGGGQSVAGLTFEEGRVSLTGGALNFTGAAALNALVGANAAMADLVAGGAGLTKTGLGTITLTNSGNTYSGRHDDQRGSPSHYQQRCAGDRLLHGGGDGQFNVRHGRRPAPARGELQRRSGALAQSLP